MGTKTILALVIGVLLASTAAYARNDRLRFLLSDALTTPAAQAKLDPKIRLYFGRQKSAQPIKVFGNVTYLRKTNFFNKSDKEGCEWAFLSAAIALQDAVRRDGGNAVINIKSVYQNEELTSESAYECNAGSLMGGVSLRGDVVLLP